MATEDFREKRRQQMLGNMLRRGKPMPAKAKEAISQSLRGNKRRTGIPHEDNVKLWIRASLKMAYENGRRAPPDLEISRKNIRRAQEMVRSGEITISYHNSKKTHCPKGHAYAGENLASNRAGERICVSCRRESCRRYYWKKKLANNLENGDIP